MAKKSVADSIQELVGRATPTKPATEKLNKVPEIGKPPKQPKKKNGGARPGAGRPEGGTSLLRRLVRDLVKNHYTEEVAVKIKDPTTGVEHTIKKPRVLIAIDMMFQIGIANKDAAALDKYLNRALGKAPQPLVGDDDEPPIQIDTVGERILEKAYDEEDDD